MGELTSRWKVQCLCTHLTSFGSDAVVPPNTIDFSNVWAKFANLNENAAVFSTVISLIGVYILLLIWLRYKDKQDLIKVCGPSSAVSAQSEMSGSLQRQTGSFKSL